MKCCKGSQQLCATIAVAVIVVQGIVAEKNLTVYSRKMKDAECSELDCHNARFGFSLANMNDVDGDGYNGRQALKLNVSMSHTLAIYTGS